MTDRLRHIDRRFHCLGIKEIHDSQSQVCVVAQPKYSLTRRYQTMGD